MSSKEKARELSHDYFRRGQLRLVSPDSERAGYECAMKMAEWKDELAAAAYCKCCDTRECEDYESDTCDWLEKFKKVLKGGEE